MTRSKKAGAAAVLLAGSLVACNDNPSGMFTDWNPTVSCAAAR